MGMVVVGERGGMKERLGYDGVYETISPAALARRFQTDVEERAEPPINSNNIWRSLNRDRSPIGFGTPTLIEAEASHRIDEPEPRQITNKDTSKCPRHAVDFLQPAWAAAALDTLESVSIALQPCDQASIGLRSSCSKGFEVER